MKNLFESVTESKWSVNESVDDITDIKYTDEVELGTKAAPKDTEEVIDFENPDKNKDTRFNDAVTQRATTDTELNPDNITFEGFDANKLKAVKFFDFIENQNGFDSLATYGRLITKYILPDANAKDVKQFLKEERWFPYDDDATLKTVALEIREKFKKHYKFESIAEGFKVADLKDNNDYLVTYKGTEAYMEYKGKKDGKHQFDNSGKITALTDAEVAKHVTNENVNEDSTMILEYLSYRISTPTELLDGLKEIKAPIQIDVKNSSVSIDGVNYRVPKNIDDIGTSVNWDSKLYDALHKNDELTAMWKTVHHKYSSIVNNLRKTKSVTGAMPNPENIDWGTTGAASINSYFQAITKLQKMLQDILANKDAQDTLRKHEVLRHLFDSGYARMFGLK